MGDLYPGWRESSAAREGGTSITIDIVGSTGASDDLSLLRRQACSQLTQSSKAGCWALILTWGD
jgi:hypothetical protein